MSPIGPFEAFFKSIDVDGLTINLERVDLVKKRATTFEVPILQRAAVLVRLCIHLEPNADAGDDVGSRGPVSPTPPPPSASAPPSTHHVRSSSSLHNLPSLLSGTLQRVTSLGSLPQSNATQSVEDGGRQIGIGGTMRFCKCRCRPGKVGSFGEEISRRN